MKSDKKILGAFILNLLFSIIEFIGGTLTNSVAIISDAVHDLGDSLSIGISFMLEKKSKKKPDDKYTFGYTRYSVMGSLFTTVILLVGSILVIYNAINRIINPVKINYDGMIILAILGFTINFVAAYFTKGGESLNQKSVNLHMLEDVLGWLVVLVGAIIMRFTDIKIIDPILSILVALFILINAFKNLKEIVDLFLEKTPSNIEIKKVEKELLSIKGVKDVHHIHIWSIDGINNYITMHLVVTKNNKKIKEIVKEKLKEYDINHTTIELEVSGDECDDKNCHVEKLEHKHHHH